MEFILCEVINSINNKFKKIINQELQKHHLNNIKYEQWLILKMLYQQKTIFYMNDLVIRLGRSRSDVTIITKNLQEKKLIVKKKETSDNRKIKLELTQKGHDLIPTIINLEKQLQSFLESWIEGKKINQIMQGLQLLDDLIPYD